MARRYVLDPAALGELAAEPEEAGDRFWATYLAALAARAIRELAALMERAARQGRRLGTAALESEIHLPSPVYFESFIEDLSQAVAGVVARHHREGPGSRPFRIFAGAYPTEGRRERQEQDKGGTG